MGIFSKGRSPASRLTRRNIRKNLASWRVPGIKGRHIFIGKAMNFSNCQFPIGRSWANGSIVPGYLDGTANFDRPVIPRCVECHATYFQTLAPSPLMNRYDKADFILGISCERCHGPGEEHVARQRGQSAAAAGEAITNPAKLSRDRRVDVCAQCHGGLGEEIAPAFSFRPGQPLAEFIELQQLPVNAIVDVHEQPGGSAGKKPVLSIVRHAGMHDLPRRARARTAGSELFKPLPGVPPARKMRHVREAGPADRGELH